MGSTPKRGKKTPPASKPGAWDKPPIEAMATKKGPGRKAKGSADAKAPRTAVAPPPLKKLKANIGRDPWRVSKHDGSPRRIWRDGEPMHIVKPVRAARRAAAEAAKAAQS